MATNRTRERLIEDQVHTWEMVGRKGAANRRRYHPIITLSRSFGAGGAALGAHLSVVTGFDIWDRTLVQAIAEEAGGDERVMATLDEHVRHTIDDAIRSLMIGLDHTNVQYFRALMRVIRTVSAHGNAIIVGRGANFAVRSEKALRVRVDASAAWRSSQYAKAQGISESAAREKIRSMDAAREEFVQHYYHRSAADACEYDLVINAESFGPDRSVELVMDAYGRKFSPLQIAAQ